MARKRTQPYTVIGIARVPCWRCEAPSWANWQVCSDGNQYRGICKQCDILLNEMVLTFMRDPDMVPKIRAYAHKVLNG